MYTYLRTKSSAAASMFMQPNGDQFVDFLFVMVSPAGRVVVRQ
jgi:hypothetical protein